MHYIADFHIHARYAYATSKQMNIPSLARWGQLKGIQIMGTGDFTHPLWQAELHHYLEQAEQGLFRLKSEYQQEVCEQTFDSCKSEQRFMLSAEIATIFRRNKRVYKLHSLILAPSFQAMEKISIVLGAIGNIVSDGRPILSLDIKDLMKIVLEASSDCMIIPAHIWTPHFGLFGSKSGFDSMEDCFEEMTPHIYALEKGLSSNFAMNARISQLDKYTLLCNSDAHSLPNLGREANIMNIKDFSYQGITQILKNNKPEEMIAGIEFFPERGKYYGNGHRACSMYANQEDTSKQNGICKVCNKPMTIGVLYRVNELADRTFEQAASFIRKNHTVLPLQDVIADFYGVESGSKKVQALYFSMLEQLGSEFFILLHASIQDIAQCSNLQIALSIQAMREGKVTVEPGFDGEYGKVYFSKSIETNI